MGGRKCVPTLIVTEDCLQRFYTVYTRFKSFSLDFKHENDLTSLSNVSSQLRLEAAGRKPSFFAASSACSVRTRRPRSFSDRVEVALKTDRGEGYDKTFESQMSRAKNIYWIINIF